MRAGVLLLLLGIATAEPTGSIHGRVLDADGKGLSYLFVTAYCVSTEEPMKRSTASADDGWFVLEDLPPGEYVLEVADPMVPAPPADDFEKRRRERRELVEHWARVYGATDHPDRVVVGAGEPLKHDIRLVRRRPVTVVVEQDGRPLPNADIVLVELDEGGTPVKRPGGHGDLLRSLEKTRTNERGEITFPAVREGFYGITLRVGDWRIGCGTMDARGEGPLRVPAAVGRCKVRMRVTDAGGKPVTAAEPTLEAEGWLHVATNPGGAQSSSGVYTIPCVREGTYTPSVVVGGAFARGEPLTVGPGSPASEVTLALPETGSLIVRILDGAGRPVADDIVSVRHPAGGPSLHLSTDGNGQVRAASLMVGAWSVSHRGGDAAQDVEIKASVQREIVLRPRATGSLAVDVMDGAGHLLRYVYVTVTHSSGAPVYHVKTDRDGRARVPDLAVGFWVVSLGRDRQDVQVDALREAWITLHVR